MHVVIIKANIVADEFMRSQQLKNAFLYGATIISYAQRNCHYDHTMIVTRHACIMLAHCSQDRELKDNLDDGLKSSHTNP